MDQRAPFFSYRPDGRPQRVVGVNIDVSERAEEQQRTLHAELDHRVKNILATVSAIAAHTKDASSSMDDFIAALDSRIQSMASTHELLTTSRWRGVSLRELVRRELAPYTSSDNTCIKGPEVVLRTEAAQTTASVLHELTTNAAKYGALSRPKGRVSIRWHHASNGQMAGPLVIEWLEAGGPPVEVPSKSGYGSSVITELVPYELGGTARLEFSPEAFGTGWIFPPNGWRRRRTKVRVSLEQEMALCGTKEIDPCARSKGRNFWCWEAQEPVAAQPHGASPHRRTNYCLWH